MWLQGQASLVAEMCRSNDRLGKMTTEDGDPQLGIFSGRSQFDTKVSERLADNRRLERRASSAKNQSTTNGENSQSTVGK